MKFITRYIDMERYNASFRKAPQKLSKRGLSLRRTKRTAVAALLSAFVVVVLLMGTLTGILDLTALALSSAVTVFCVIEFGGAYPYLVWAVASVCAFLFLPDKFVACEYFLFAGIYPVLKNALSRLPFKASLPLKLLAFNAVLTAFALISQFVLRLPADTGLFLGVPLYLAGNALFILYDLALTSVTTYYIVRLRRVLKADRL